ncbi:MAG: RNA polymerase sigma factor [Deltaproteobacteria bacterium]|nr:RNA polymerase sigma factor [Deltaproteobacteria bacterium]
MSNHDATAWECPDPASALASALMNEDRAQSARRIEELADEVGPLALSIATRMLGDRTLAQDALQDAFVQAYRGLSGFRGDSSLRTWFLRILVNSCRRHRLLMRRWIAGTRRTELENPGADVHTDTHGDPALRARLERAVLALPHRQRTAFVLRYVHDLGIAEIAGIMGCAEGTVKATIHKAVRRMRRELQDLDAR